MEGPTLAKLMEDAINAELVQVNTCLVAKVVAVDVAAAKVDVQPVLKRRYADETLKEMPVITSVPIANYRAGDAFITLPVKVGHYVELRFSQRSLDIWLNKGGVVDPQDRRKFHLQDAIAYPGIYPFTEPPQGATADDIIIKNADAKITIKPSGKFLFASASEELMTQLIALAEQVQLIADTLGTTTTNTIFGPMQLNDFTTFTQAGVDVETIKGKIEGLKG